MVEDGRIGGRENACMARAMDENVTNEADLERNEADPKSVVQRRRLCAQRPLYVPPF